MPDPLTLGHLLHALALVLALLASWQLLAWAANRGHGRGTPQYARARDGRRYGLWLGLIALIFLALARLTPLGGIAIL